MTIKMLVELAKGKGYSMDTEIKIMGTDVSHHKFMKEDDGTEIVILDEQPIEEQISMVYW